MGIERASLKTLFEGASNDDIDAVRSVIMKYISIDTDELDVLASFKDGRGRSALHFAAQCHSVKVLKFVLQHSKKTYDCEKTAALVNLADAEGITPLMCCCQDTPLSGTPPSRYIDTVHLLTCSTYGDAKIPLATKSGATALHYACSSGSMPVVCCLLDKLVDIRLQKGLLTRQSEGGTPLHWAAASTAAGCPGIIHHLVKTYELDVDLVEGRGLPSLILSAASSNDETSSALIECGADVGFILQGGVTLAHMAADCGLEKTMKALLTTESGKETAVRENDSGETPTVLAAQHGYREVVRLLLQSIHISGDAVDAVDGKAVDECIASVLAKEAIKGKKEADGTVEHGNVEHSIASTAQPLVDPVEAAATLAAQESLLKANSYSAEDIASSLSLKAEGNALYSKGEWALACSSYSAAITLYPLDATYFSNRSACYLALKQVEKALVDAIYVRIIKPDWSKGHYRLAKARLELGRYEDAAVAAWGGVSIDDSNEELKALLQRCVKKGKQDHQGKVKKDNEMR